MGPVSAVTSAVITAPTAQPANNRREECTPRAAAQSSPTESRFHFARLPEDEQRGGSTTAASAATTGREPTSIPPISQWTMVNDCPKVGQVLQQENQRQADAVHRDSGQQQRKTRHAPAGSGDGDHQQQRQPGSYKCRNPDARQMADLVEAEANGHHRAQRCPARDPTV